MATEVQAPPAGWWDPEADDQLRCVAVHQETHDVRSFTFVSPAGKQFRFGAGQYFLFDFPVGDAVESRCYSISSPPTRPGSFTITVKRVAGGVVSNWLHDNLTPGASVRAQGPRGTFLRPVAETRKYLFLSGGSGITPVMSMLREIADTAEVSDVVFLHAGRTPQDFVFREELALLAGRIKGLRLFLLPEARGGEPAWPGLTGRISAELMALAVPDMAERVVMCCGPAPFMAAARSIAASLGVPPGRYLEESFDAAVLEAPLPEAAPATRTFKVQFAKQNRTIEVGVEQTVLSCAKKAGVRIPSSCANGICGTCKSRLVSGSVDMKHGGGIRQREIDAGMFLPCCSRPLSDLVIER
ncbi:hybrid-cluster NAD(P)-dependent oxidoreductase [Paracoccus sp. (in: a-proteobacteria)]|uniref:hybrid-cluster NAD(P)-dependent oxidoreductase n=1 Tax=Paracoccus sp. TaxID=267 RepID=UPI0026DF4DBC|nr:hybrid-cluster NAD(P)-dependent oxidoreductase [Paracoccus sp. (in: a-proteobacteria)]MDO5371029.1 hybrid-cluster NAD(P)-dependent oxidoreductase [Paracoccus sp. (in: a-proteobacteria)]